jgi:hydrogenase maturation protein HypF
LPYGLVRQGGLLIYDPRSTIRAILEGRAGGATTEALAARFQETIAAVTRELVGEIGRETGLRAAVLSGGVFQNQWLATTLVRRLAGDGFEVYTNQMVPANDGGISYGQAAVAAARLAGAS